MLGYILAILVCIYGIYKQAKLVKILFNNGNGEGGGMALIMVMMFTYLLGYVLYIQTL